MIEKFSAVEWIVVYTASKDPFEIRSHYQRSIKTEKEIKKKKKSSFIYCIRIVCHWVRRRRLPDAAFAYDDSVMAF